MREYVSRYEFGWSYPYMPYARGPVYDCTYNFMWMLNIMHAMNWMLD